MRGPCWGFCLPLLEGNGFDPLRTGDVQVLGYISAFRGPSIQIDTWISGSVCPLKGQLLLPRSARINLHPATARDRPEVQLKLLRLKLIQKTKVDLIEPLGLPGGVGQVAGGICIEVAVVDLRSDDQLLLQRRLARGK